MTDKDTQLIEYLERVIVNYHGIVYAVSSTLYEHSEIIQRSEVPAKIRLKNTKFCVLDDDESLPQTRHIKNAVSYEVQEFEFQWETASAMNNVEEIKDLVFFDEKLILEVWSWDDPNLPKEVIENYDSVDHESVGQDLEEWYEGLENINYDDFPKSLVPMIKRCVDDYIEYQKKNA